MRSDRIPSHIAVIMDGNGRWAKQRLLPRKFGHREGVKVIDRIADAVFSRGIRVLTVFAFSTENWNRPQDEVNGLLDLFKKYIRKKTPEMVRKNICLRILGDQEVFDDEIRSLIADAYEKTGNNTAGTLCICFNYGGRADIVAAANKLIEKGERADERTFASALSTAGLPDPDIVIRTGGEHRISNFLLYQMAYSEIYFTRTLWPDFSADELDGILADYAGTERRFGGLEGQ